MTQPVAAKPPAEDPYDIEAEFAHQSSNLPPPVAPADPKGTDQPGSRQIPPKDPVTGRFVKPHPDRLMRIARHFGISDEEMAGMDAAKLREEIGFAQIERDLQHRQAAHERHAQNNPVPNPPPPPAPPPIDLDDSFDPALRDVVAKLVKRIDELENRVTVVEPIARAAGERSVTEQFDAFFNKHPDIFGQGSATELDPNGDDFERRKMLAQRAMQYDDSLSIATKLDKAYKLLYGHVARRDNPPPDKQRPRGQQNGHIPSEPAGGSRRPTPEEWDSAGLGVPTRHGEPPDVKEQPGVARAVRAVQNYYLAQNGEAGPETTPDDFPE